MQFLKSLICWQGFDNRNRFFAIQSASYISFIVLTHLFAQATVFSIFVLLTCTALTLISTRRRLNDSELTKNWLYLPPALFLLLGLVIVLLNQPIACWLLVLPMLITSVLLTYSEKNNKNYILGYWGPVDLSEFAKPAVKQRSTRIEPTLAHANGGSAVQQTPAYEADTFQDEHINQGVSAGKNDLGETIRLTLLKKKPIVIASVAAVVVILILIIANALVSTETVEEQQVQEVIEQVPVERLAKITLPDDFSLMLSSYDGLTIEWQADQSEQNLLWSQQTASGDKSCSVIRFNNGDEIRTLTVDVESGSQYFANFSPLDSKKIVKSLALRGSFTLCGYSFSLKGSQAVLGKHAKYADFLSN
ncbi:hypothetical protein [Thalassotalea sp. PLHSN55]|uniref:hypothetical protein n=1 Tax=Thalassotalea sp. PLHSN55 TaxID=3435888 RepID=UPI003F856090